MSVLTCPESLFLHLEAAPDVNAIAGKNIYPVMAPQDDAGPMIVFALAGRSDDLLLRGPATMASTRWDIDCVSREYDQAHRLAEAVIASLNYFKGPLGGPDGVYVEACTLADARDEVQLERGLFIVNLQFEIKYR
jgi:hypothetical protein